MGLLSKIKQFYWHTKRQAHGHQMSDREFELVRGGFVPGHDDCYYPPDSVWVASGSKVYHAGGECCCGLESTDAFLYPEAEAVRRGLRRCKKCEWSAQRPVPAPSKKALKPSNAVARFKS